MIAKLIGSIVVAGSLVACGHHPAPPTPTQVPVPVPVPAPTFVPPAPSPTPSPPVPAPIPDPGPPVIIYTVVKGDTLWGISFDFYGDGSVYQVIAEANNITNPDLIYPGQVFIIPRMGW